MKTLVLFAVLLGISACAPRGGSGPQPTPVPTPTPTPVPAVVSVDIVSPADGSTTGPTVSFLFTASPTALVFNCELDAVILPCDLPSGAGTQLVTAGAHNFTVTATDSEGNIGYDSVNWVVDAQGPTVTINSPLSTHTSDSGTYSFSATETADYMCSIDGGAFFNCASGDGFAAFPPGPHTLEVIGFDQFGNQGPTASVTFTVL